MIFTPKTDGIDHVNIYSRGKTQEGRLLSNFAHTPFTLYGIRVASVEGFYQSMLFDDEETRSLVAATYGQEAKAWGKRSGKRAGEEIKTWDGRVVKFEGEEFYDEVRKAIKEKIQQNPSVAEALVATEELPLTHYYVMWGRPVIPRNGAGILEDCLMSLREELREQALLKKSQTG